MDKTKIGVNIKATEDFIDQLRSFIIKRYVEIYNCNPLLDYKNLNEKDEYLLLIEMLSAIYENELAVIDKDHFII